MAFIAISGEAGCRHEELARMAAQRFDCGLITELELDRLIASEFGDRGKIPQQAWRSAATCVLAGLGASLGTEPALVQRHLVVCCPGVEMLAEKLPGTFRFHMMAPESIRLANLAAVGQAELAGAKIQLRKIESAGSQVRKRRFGQKDTPATRFDLIVNERAMGLDQMLNLLALALEQVGLEAFSASAAARVQFQVRFKLARYGLVPSDRVQTERKTFGHPSEEVFANLLDFYRIAWEYEPRSFPLQWAKNGQVSEAFTPDFYLPEFDLYVELTTMKQANVTKKNRKIRLLRAIYPHVNIQIFYQKDVQDLVMNYRLPERLTR
jgi:hypothetical protein